MISLGAQLSRHSLGSLSSLVREVDVNGTLRKDWAWKDGLLGRAVVVIENAESVHAQVP